ncbi:MAG: SPOR domain-containing protein [Sphingomicrobium sp.]
MPIRRAIRLMLLPVALGAAAIPAAAQYSPYAPAPPVIADPSSSLANALRTLATQPKDLGSLIAAGRASLALGDMQAAAGFFGRAEEYYPSSPAAKIGVGAAKTMMGDARGAMLSFDQAQALGAPQSMLAFDRGLAFDLLGQQSKAQSDYRAALFGTQADEARRRLALSLAISKDLKGAAATLQPLLARRDPGAVRTNAFVLALGGDREGARRTIDAALPGAGARFDPFFRMLPMLRADEKAMAVHLGEFPKDAARRYAPPAPLTASPTAPISTGSQRVESALTAIQITPPKNAKPAVALQAPARPPSPVRETVLPSTLLAMSSPPPTPLAVASKPRAPDTEAVTRIAPPEEKDPGPRPGFKADDLAPVAEASEPLLPASKSAVLNAEGEPLVSDKVALAPPPRPAPKLEIKPPPAPKPKVEVAKTKKAEPLKPKELAKPKETPKPKESAKPKEPPKPKEPTSSLYVQLASGANADRMGTEFKRIKGKKPELFAGRPVRVTNGKDLFRLVIGPFKSKDESSAFVNQLSKAGIDGFSYTAPDGMTFDKLPTK